MAEDYKKLEEQMHKQQINYENLLKAKDADMSRHKEQSEQENAAQKNLFEKQLKELRDLLERESKSKEELQHSKSAQQSDCI
jgi:hypothetical protein